MLMAILNVQVTRTTIQLKPTTKNYFEYLESDMYIGTPTAGTFKVKRARTIRNKLVQELFPKKCLDFGSDSLTR